jgi:hypothetical protein
MVFVDLAAVLLEIVVEETFEEKAGHARPFAHDVDVEAAEEVQPRVGHGVADRADAGGVPGVDWAVGQDYFGVGVGGDEFWAKGAGGEVAYGLEGDVSVIEPSG